MTVPFFPELLQHEYSIFVGTSNLVAVFTSAYGKLHVQKDCHARPRRILLSIGIVLLFVRRIDEAQIFCVSIRDGLSALSVSHDSVGTF